MMPDTISGVKTVPNLPLFIPILLMMLGLVSSDSFAFTCDMITLTVDDARTYLRRAAKATDLDDAQHYARRAQGSLDDAALSARDCDCDMASIEFDDAASRARRAKNAGSADDFVDELNRAIRAFNSALDALRMCSSKSR